MKGVELVNRKYIPLFPYYYEELKHVAFKIVSDGYVSTEDGTGIVHQAPGFGEEDYRVCL